MRVLVDTHAFLWDLLEDKRSSRKARQILSGDEHELFFSIVSLWEISILQTLGRLKAIGSSIAYVRGEVDRYSMQLLPLRLGHVEQLEMLPLHHRDPFDRMLIAQSIAESLPILTSDLRFKDYPAKLIW